MGEHVPAEDAEFDLRERTIDQLDAWDTEVAKLKAASKLRCSLGIHHLLKAASAQATLPGEIRGTDRREGTRPYRAGHFRGMRNR